jgi:uncharacterized membrane protein (DUF106 family)
MDLVLLARVLVCIGVVLVRDFVIVLLQYIHIIYKLLIDQHGQQRIGHTAALNAARHKSSGAKNKKTIKKTNRVKNYHTQLNKKIK